MSRFSKTGLIAVAALALVAGACGGSASNDGGGSGSTRSEKIDYAAIGLWDDGPCDKSKPPLVVGTSTVFESPVISLGDLANALKAAAIGVQRPGRGERFVHRGPRL